MSITNYKVNIENKIATVAFNRPEKANSLDIQAWEEMKAVFDDLSENKNVRVIILKGVGKHFCAGMDLETLMSIPSNFDSDCPAQQRTTLRKFIVKIQEIISAIENCRKPVIAAVHGACIGGGLNIITACDMRYCSDDAYFSIKEVDLGLVADIGVLQRMPEIVNPGLMAELAFTGRNFDGKEAAKINLVNASYATQDELMAKVQHLAENIASKSPLVIRGIKEMLLYKRDHSVQDSMQYMASWNAGMLMSEDLTEAMMANMQKRTGKYKD